MNGINGVFRKKQSFTMVPNEVARNKKLSQRAKGLYVHIMSYITYEDFNLTKSFLLENSLEGEKAFDNAWNELKINGYLKIYFVRNKSGKWRTEYDLLESSFEPDKHTFYCDAKGEILSTNLDRAKKKETKELSTELKQKKKKDNDCNTNNENSICICDEDSINNKTSDFESITNKEISIKDKEKNEEKYRTPKKGVTVEMVEKAPYPLFGSNGFGSNGKGGNNNNTIYNTTNNTNEYSKYNLSIHPSYKGVDGKMDKSLQYDYHLEKLRTQVNYYRNTKFENEYTKIKRQEDYDDILKILADALSNSKSLRINQETIQIDKIRERFKMLKVEHIEYLLSVLKNNKNKIRNIRAFILTAAYNSITNIGLYQTTEAIYDINNGFLRDT